MMKRLIIVVLACLLLCLPRLSWSVCSWVGNTGTVASNDVADVADCVSYASGKTGVVKIQMLNASSTWGSALTVDMSSGFANVTSLTIQGSGTAPSQGSANETQITNSGISLTTSSAKTVRISNIKFTGTPSGTGMISIGGTARPGLGGGWRVDHCTFNTTSSRSVWVSGYTYGVIDSCNITTQSAVGIGIREAPDGSGNDSWARVASFGTAEAVYVESNYIEYTPTTEVHMCVDSDAGGRYVARYNTTKNCYFGTHDCSSLSARSNYSWEIYNNTMTQDRSYQSGMFGLRGGTGYVYNNTVSANSYSFYGEPMSLSNYRSFDYAGASPWTTECSPSTRFKWCLGSGNFTTCTTDADCGGESGACQYADDPTGDGYDYPCRDQIGRSTNMALRPALFWNNKISYDGGAQQNLYPEVSGGGYSDNHMQLTRDFCQAATTMPATCNGVTTEYASLAYPHPLSGEGTTPPSATGCTISGGSFQ